MAIVEIKQWPIGTPTPSYSSFLAATHQILHRFPGIAHQVTPTATVLEGDLTTCLAAAEQMHRMAFQHGVARVMTSITIDERIDKPMSGPQMVAEVEQAVPLAPVFSWQASPLG